MSKTTSADRLIRKSAAKFGATVDPGSVEKWYVTAPPGKVWATYGAGHVLMVVNYHPDDLAMGLGWIAAGVIDCPESGCEFCRRDEIAAQERGLRVGLDSACL